MEKINRLPLSKISSLKKLEDNWEQWGKEYQEFRTSKGANGQGFSWREGIDKDLKPQLELQTNEHCSFCDVYPVEKAGRKEIEHYFPKAQYPCLAYCWDNLFYICTKCNAEANKYKSFEFTLKPDLESYSFKDYFYFDPDSGELKILENLKTDAPNQYECAQKFLKRYGINASDKVKKARYHLYQDIINFLKADNPTDQRERNDFEYRYIFDFAKRMLNQ